MSTPSLPEEITNIKFLNVSYRIKLDTLLPSAVTSDLSIQPTEFFAKGDRYLGKVRDPQTNIISEIWRERPSGIWRINTRDMNLPHVPADHILYLLSVLEPKKNILVVYLEKCSISFYIDQKTIYPSTVELSSKILERMSRLCHFMEVFSEITLA